MRDFLILGASGTARALLSWMPAFAAAGLPWRCVGLLDDDSALTGTEVDGVPVLGPLAAAAARHDVRLVDALGGPRSFRRREQILRSAGLDPARFETLIHPLAFVAPGAAIGPGSLIFPFAFIGHGVHVGSHVTMLSHVAVNHDTVIGDFTILASLVGIAGRVRLGAACYIGMGARIIQDGEVGSGAMVGMGSVVIRAVPPGVTVAGNPARAVSGGRDARR